jgi:hypothetical protein
MSLAEEYRKLGYAVIRQMVDASESARLYAYTLKNLERGNQDDGQVPGSPSFYQDQEMVVLQKKLLPQFEESIQVKLLNVFTYHRVYRGGAILRVHKDSTRAEISASVNLGQKGEPWDLWLMDYDENAHKVTLAPGDALIYNGNHLCHWRGKLVSSDFVSQVMFHFVNKEGKNTLAAKTEIIRKIRQRCRKLFGITY